MRKKFRGYKDGKEFIYFEMGSIFPLLNLKQMALIKRRLLGYPEGELRTLRASLNASHSMSTNFTPFSTFLILLISGCSVLLSSLTIALMTFGSNVYIGFLRGDFSNQTKFTSKFTDQLSKDFDNSNIIDVFHRLFLNNVSGYFQVFGIIMLIVFLIIVGYYYYFSRISKLKYLLDEVIEEKIRINDNRWYNT